MPQISIRAISEYLQSLHAKPVRVISVTGHGAQEEGDNLKGYGYGSPLFLEYEVEGELKKAVLETMAPSTYGHDHFSDRAQAILWEHSTFNNLPRHVRSLDCGAFLDTGGIVSTGKAREFFLLTEFAAGKGYFKDLERLRDGRPQPSSTSNALKRFPITLSSFTPGNTTPLAFTPAGSGTSWATGSASWGLSTITPSDSSSSTRLSSRGSRAPVLNGGGALKAGAAASAGSTEIFTPGTSCSVKMRTLPLLTARAGNGANPRTTRPP